MQKILPFALSLLLLLAACGQAAGESQLSEPEPREESSRSSEPESREEPSQSPSIDPEEEEEPLPDPLELEDPERLPAESAGDAPPFEGTGVPEPEPQWDPQNLITFHIVDEAGNPVPYVSGGLEKRSDDGMSVGYSGLGSMSGPACTDESGNLFWIPYTYTGKTDPFLNSVCTLELYAYYDTDLRRSVRVQMPAEVPATFTITWIGDLPPGERPSQTTGVRFLIVDPQGKPVEGITMLGTDYPKEHEGPVPAIAGPYIGPTDATGVIRWDGNFEAGTYPISFYREGVEGADQPYTLIHPGGEKLMEITIVWAPPVKEPGNGIRFTVIDVNHNPVQGVVLSTPYYNDQKAPKTVLEATGPDGKTFCANPGESGGYKVIGTKDGTSREFSFPYYKTGYVAEETLVWK